VYVRISNGLEPGHRPKLLTLELKIEHNKKCTIVPIDWPKYFVQTLLDLGNVAALQTKQID